MTELLCARLCHQPLHEERRLVAAREESPLHGCLLAAVVPGLHVPAWRGTVVGTGKTLEGSGPIRHCLDKGPGTAVITETVVELYVKRVYSDKCR